MTEFPRSGIRPSITSQFSRVIERALMLLNQEVHHASDDQLYAGHFRHNVVHFLFATRSFWWEGSWRGRSRRRSWRRFSWWWFSWRRFSWWRVPQRWVRRLSRRILSRWNWTRLLRWLRPRLLWPRLL